MTPRPHRSDRKLALSGVTITALILTLVTIGRADAPEGHYSTRGESVLDSKTGLTWQRNATGPLTWVEAVQHCVDFNADLHDGWRLPSMKELQTLVDEAKKPAPLIDSAFNGVDAADWTSSEIFGEPDQVFVVNIGGNGDATPSLKTSPGVARCVWP